MIHFGIGFTYGIKNTIISNLGKFVLFLISFSISIISLYFGNFIKFIFPEFITNYLGSFIFIIIGLFISFHSFKKEKEDNHNYIENNKNFSEEKTYSLFIKFLGITIKIIKNPIYSDLDNSNKIDSKEALFLGLALSMDSICIGIGGGIIGINTYIFPFLIGFFQLFFLKLGTLLGKKLYNFSKLPSNIWSIISGILLIFIGILKFII